MQLSALLSPYTVSSRVLSTVYIYDVLLLVKDAMPSSLVHGYQHFGGMWCHNLQGRHSSELHSTTSQKTHNLNDPLNNTNVTSKCINTLIYYFTNLQT